MNKLLIIYGPTATGKTAFAVKLAKQFNGELISADSRQVYTGLDIITGKDIPINAKRQMTNVKWGSNYLNNYLIDDIPIWGYDLVTPDQSFSVSLWRDMAISAISNIHSRGKLPIVVGGTGLYLQSLTSDLDLIQVPPDRGLRKKLSRLSVSDLFTRLMKVDPQKANSLNNSDKNNPRRLIRALEIALHKPPSLRLREGQGVSYVHLSLCLSAPLEFLYHRIEMRIKSRLDAGAVSEAQAVGNLYGWGSPGLTALGYKNLKLDPDISAWALSERQYSRRQLTWFKKQPNLTWFDIANPHWETKATTLFTDWYNKH